MDISFCCYFVIGRCLLAQDEDLDYLCLKVESLVEHFVVQLFTGSVSRENCYLYSHGTMSSEDQFFKDILILNVTELPRELEKNALPTAAL